MINMNEDAIRKLTCEEVGVLAKLRILQGRNGSLRMNLQDMSYHLGFCIKKTQKILLDLEEKGFLEINGEATQTKEYTILDGVTRYHKEPNRNIKEEIIQQKQAKEQYEKQEYPAEKPKKTVFQKTKEFVAEKIDKVKKAVMPEKPKQKKFESRKEYNDFFEKTYFEIHGQNCSRTAMEKSRNRCWELNSQNQWRYGNGQGGLIPDQENWVLGFIKLEVPVILKEGQPVQTQAQAKNTYELPNISDDERERTRQRLAEFLDKMKQANN